MLSIGAGHQPLVVALTTRWSRESPGASDNETRNRSSKISLVIRHPLGHWQITCEVVDVAPAASAHGTLRVRSREDGAAQVGRDDSAACPIKMFLCLSERNKSLSAFGPPPHTKADENGRKDTKIHEKDTPVNHCEKQA
jgi:hypothetical protein